MGNQAHGLSDWSDFSGVSHVPCPKGKGVSLSLLWSKAMHYIEAVWRAAKASELAGTELMSASMFSRDQCAPTWVSSLASASLSRG